MYQIGSLIEYESHGGPRTVTVVKQYANLPHWNKPGFDGEWVVGDKTLLVWGFDEMITKVLRYDPAQIDA